MSASITNSTHIDFAKFLMEGIGDISYPPTYFFAGKIDDWTDPSVVDDPSGSYLDSENTIKEILYAKKMNGSDCTLAIKKYVWQSGTHYSKWRNDIDMNNQTKWLSYLSPFYVYAEFDELGTTKRNIYICLDNTDINGNLLTSTVKPTGSSYTPFITSDGYKWIFITSILNTENTLFANDVWIPIAHQSNRQSLETQAMITNTTPGTIDSAVIVSGGTGYNSLTTVATVVGDGTGASVGLTILNGVIIGYNIVNRGSGYTTCSLTITGDGSGGKIHLIKSPDGGHGYQPEVELLANYVLFRGQFSNTESGLFDDFGIYRKIGMIRGMKNTSGTLLSGAGYDFRSILNINNAAGPFSPGSTITGLTTNASAMIHKTSVGDGDTLNLYLINKRNEFIALQAILGTNGTSSGVVNEITNPDIDFMTGTIIYIEHLVGITRKTAQSEVFLFTIEL